MRVIDIIWWVLNVVTVVGALAAIVYFLPRRRR